MVFAPQNTTRGMEWSNSYFYTFHNHAVGDGSHPTDKNQISGPHFRDNCLGRFAYIGFYFYLYPKDRIASRLSCSLYGVACFLPSLPSVCMGGKRDGERWRSDPFLFSNGSITLILSIDVMKSEVKFGLGLAIGVALGAAIAYFSDKEKRDSFVDDVMTTADKARDGLVEGYYEAKAKYNQYRNKLKKASDDLMDGLDDAPADLLD